MNTRPIFIKQIGSVQLNELGRRSLLLLRTLRCLLICFIVQTSSTCFGAGGVTAFESDLPFTSPEEAWQSRAGFREVTQAPEFLGWAKGPRWVWLQARTAVCVQASNCLVYFGAPPVVRYEAWSIDAQTGSATHLTSGGAAAPRVEGSSTHSPRVVIPWPHATDSVLVRFEPIATAVIDPQLIDAVALNRLARLEGWIAGTIFCLLFIAFTFHAYSIYARRSRSDMERVGIILTACIWILVFNLFVDESLRGWSGIYINRFISTLLATILILINFQIIDLFNIHEEPRWIENGLRIVGFSVIPSCVLGEIIYGSSLQGLMTNAGIQALIFLAAAYRRYIKGDPDARRLIWLGVKPREIIHTFCEELGV
ncbi:hypothetical protein [Ideonella sp.]|uniref:hypothetical protein n=1 Tax=Ideonella sp. TaxID=1929293 RepID=UPI0037BE2F15